MKFYIGKVNGDTFGRKHPWRYLTRSFHNDKSVAESLAEYYAGFAAWEVVQVELKEVKPKKSRSTHRKD